MSHKSKPNPKISRAGQSRKVVTIHQSESVGHNKGIPPKPPTILSRDNGSTFSGQVGAGSAPGAAGAPVTAAEPVTSY
jgi:hypothetical protein